MQLDAERSVLVSFAVIGILLIALRSEVGVEQTSFCSHFEDLEDGAVDAHEDDEDDHELQVLVAIRCGHFEL